MTDMTVQINERFEDGQRALSHLTRLGPFGMRPEWGHMARVNPRGHTMACAQPKLSLLVDPAYMARGPVPVRVVLANTSPLPLLMNTRLIATFQAGQGDLYFDLAGPDGKVYEARAFRTLGRLADEDFRLLEPGGSVERVLDLADEYWVRAPGVYQAAVTYRNRQEWARSGHEAWVGQVTSPLSRIVLD